MHPHGTHVQMRRRHRIGRLSFGVGRLVAGLPAGSSLTLQGLTVSNTSGSGLLMEDKTPNLLTTVQDSVFQDVANTGGQPLWIEGRNVSVLASAPTFLTPESSWLVAVSETRRRRGGGVCVRCVCVRAHVCDVWGWEQQLHRVQSVLRLAAPLNVPDPRKASGRLACCCRPPATAPHSPTLPSSTTGIARPSSSWQTSRAWRAPSPCTGQAAPRKPRRRATPSSSAAPTEQTSSRSSRSPGGNMDAAKRTGAGSCGLGRRRSAPVYKHVRSSPRRLFIPLLLGTNTYDS